MMFSLTVNVALRERQSGEATCAGAVVRSGVPLPHRCIHLSMLSVKCNKQLTEMALLVRGKRDALAYDRGVHRNLQSS
ncbi:hypothetical protein HH212_17170 [Massilia forsythiae]|uniref:Uncharacterized protein n=1 Tax=Massilia forsythiae TaxID=2728020 RepID=A0A7Z2VY25_9BURK|nr:hypothetical protein [Massilia forsythiae]QJE01546.1 hypothetical protein HH212_17170 [Massilia forsythiae]